jgi:glycosyltransferase involved in cell wall biosynthesis
MHIAYLGIKGLPASSGAERVVEAVTQQLVDRHDITIYCSSRYTPRGTSVPRVHLVRLPCLGGKYSHMTSVDFLAAWHALLCGNYDLIHLHNIEAGFTLPLLRLRYKVIATAHGRITAANKWGRVPAALMRTMEWPYARLSTVCTSVSQEDATQLHQRYQREVLYIPNGVEVSPVADVTAARGLLAAHGLPEQGYVLCAAGRIIPLKGVRLLLEAFRGLEGDYRLVIVGDLSHAPEYATQLRRLADARVTFLPFLQSRAHLLGLIQQCGLFVFPSTQEAMSIVLLEAASVGAPILCSDILANRSIIPEQALYFANGDVADLAAKLTWALHRSAEMKSLGAQAEAWVKARFNWVAIAEQYDQLYREVAGAN